MTDGQILGRMRAGQQDALERLMARYRGYVYTIIANMLGGCGTSDAEELTEDTFLAVWEHADRIKAGKLKAYLCVTARNKARDYLRARGPLPMDLDEIELPDGGSSLDEALIRKERAAKVRAAIHKMKPKDREIFLRYYFYLQPTETIAREMRMQPGTVRSRLSRGRNLLRETLSKEDLS